MNVTIRISVFWRAVRGWFFRTCATPGCSGVVTTYTRWQLKVLRKRCWYKAPRSTVCASCGANNVIRVLAMTDEEFENS